MMNEVCEDPVPEYTPEDADYSSHSSSRDLDADGRETDESVERELQECPKGLFSPTSFYSNSDAEDLLACAFVFVKTLTSEIIVSRAHFSLEFTVVLDRSEGAKLSEEEKSEPSDLPPGVEEVKLPEIKPAATLPSKQLFSLILATNFVESAKPDLLYLLAESLEIQLSIMKCEDDVKIIQATRLKGDFLEFNQVFADLKKWFGGHVNETPKL